MADPGHLRFLIAVYLVTRDVRMIVTLMIFTSPAELGLATPLVMIAAIARAARSGILIKGGLYLELLARVDVMVFDKTGTLTANKPQVVRIDLKTQSFPKMSFFVWLPRRIGAQPILWQRLLSIMPRANRLPYLSRNSSSSCRGGV